MKSRLASITASVFLMLLLNAAMAQASTELGLHVEVTFDTNCPAMHGYWHTGTVPSLSTAYPADQLTPISWSPDDPITFDTIEGFNGRDPGDGFVFSIIAPDQETVLFSKPIDLKYEVDQSNPYYELIARVDCSSVPYSEVTDPNTAMPGNAPRPWLPIGGVLLATAVGIGWRTLRRSRAGATRSG